MIIANHYMADEEYERRYDLSLPLLGLSNQPAKVDEDYGNPPVRYRSMGDKEEMSKLKITPKIRQRFICYHTSFFMLDLIIYGLCV